MTRQLLNADVYIGLRERERDIEDVRWIDHSQERDQSRKS